MKVKIESPEIVTRNIKEWEIPQPDNDYMVVVQCSTYNHEKYIEDALKGFVMQKTNFPWCVIVTDDCSTDGTAEIVKKYASEYPEIIKAICLGYNHMQNGISRDPYIKPWHNSAKYIAICEGDDYWTDSLKLQKQVDFLNAHPDIVYSCHRYNFIHDLNKIEHLQPNKYFDTPAHSQEKEFVFNKEYAFTQEWITKTLTCVYRQSALPKDYIKAYKYARDVHMVYHLLCKGDGVCHNFVGGTYRYTHQGVYAGLDDLKKCNINYEVYLELYKKNHDLLMRRHAEGYFEGALYKGRSLGFPTNIVEFHVYIKHFGKNPIRLIKIYRKYYKKAIYSI